MLVGVYHRSSQLQFESAILCLVPQKPVLALYGLVPRLLHLDLCLPFELALLQSSQLAVCLSFQARLWRDCPLQVHCPLLGLGLGLGQGQG